MSPAGSFFGNLLLSAFQGFLCFVPCLIIWHIRNTVKQDRCKRICIEKGHVVKASCVGDVKLKKRTRSIREDDYETYYNRIVTLEYEYDGIVYHKKMEITEEEFYDKNGITLYFMYYPEQAVTEGRFKTPVWPVLVVSLGVVVLTFFGVIPNIMANM